MTDPVFEGPLWYRARIRTFGPFLALVLPVALWLLDIIVRSVLSGRIRGWSTLLLRLSSAPGLLAVGYPFALESERPIGVVLSIPIWLVVGFVASRVATRNPVALFRDYWRAYGWLAAAVVVGAIVAIVLGGVLTNTSLVTQVI
jgi:hypothetical protein